MRLAKYALTSLILIFVAIATLVTLGINNQGSIFYVAALWVFIVTLLVLGSLVLRGYQRLVARIGTIAERLSELGFLQERRYEQLSGRLDGLRDTLKELKDSPQTLNLGTGHTTTIPQERRNSAELEDLSARLQKAERRILGRLEDELHADDHRLEQFDKLVAEFRQLKEHRFNQTESRW